MFSFVVKYLGFLKSIPLIAILYDSLIRLWFFATKPQLLDWLDDIEETISKYPNTSITVHKYGGTQFNYLDKEFGHLHSNGLLDIRLNRTIKQQLLKDGKIQNHHVFKNSGWISFYITNEQDCKYAMGLLLLAYEKKASIFKST